MATAKAVLIYPMAIARRNPYSRNLAKLRPRPKARAASRVGDARADGHNLGTVEDGASPLPSRAPPSEAVLPA